MRTKLARFVLHAAFGIGVCAATATVGHAQYGSYAPPSGYGPPGSASPYPVVQAQGAPGVPSMPRIGGQQPSTPQTPQAPEQPQAGQQPQAAPESAAAAPSAETGATGAEAAAAGVGAESSGGFLGRADADNRFNLFDNNSAFPLNRVWFTYETTQNFASGIISSPQFASKGFTSVLQGIGQAREENLYRFGGELKLSDHCSISFQDQYIASPGTQNVPDAWGDPEFMLKWAFILEQNNAMALTLGCQPQVASHNGEVHEKDTRFFPGILAYQGSEGGFFMQEGAQFGISSKDLSDTFDWALDLGYWIYRAPTSEGNHPCLTGIAPQVEVFGKHVMLGSQSNPYENPDQGVSSSVSSIGGGLPFREPRNVIDVTAGGRVLIKDAISISAGYSFPVTGADVRRNEFLANITFLF